MKRRWDTQEHLAFVAVPVIALVAWCLVYFDYRDAAEAIRHLLNVVNLVSLTWLFFKYRRFRKRRERWRHETEAILSRMRDVADDPNETPLVKLIEMRKLEEEFHRVSNEYEAKL